MKEPTRRLEGPDPPREEDSSYHSFLVRAWKEEAGWQVQIQHLQSAEKRQLNWNEFTDLEALILQIFSSSHTDFPSD